MTTQPIEIDCADCGNRIGYFLLERLPLPYQLSLKAMAVTMGGGDKSDASTKGLPVVCAVCHNGLPDSLRGELGL